MTLDPLGDGLSIVQLIDHLGDDQRVVRAARVSLAGDGQAWREREDPALIRYMLRHGHWCYDDQTEVLTRQGWKLWSRVAPEDELAAVNITERTMHYERPQALTADPYDGQMYRVSNQSLDLLVTPNHRMVVATRKGGGKRSEYGFQTAEKVEGRQVYYLSSAQLTKRRGFENPWGIEASLFARLIGFFIGDGFAGGTDANYISFNLRLEHKRTFLRELCEAASLTLTERASGTMCVRLAGAREWFRSHTYTPEGTKCLPTLLLEATEAEIASLLAGLRNSDGSAHRNTWVYDTTSRTLVDQLQQLAATNNFRFNVHSPRHGEGNQALCYRLHFTNRVTPEVSNYHPNGISQEGWEEYRGIVYCATVSTGALIVRRNGKVVVSGNSPFEHPQVTLMVKCPLFIRAQWMRHRHSFNEISGRYTEVPDEFYMPREFRRQAPTNRQASVEDDGTLDHEFLREQWQIAVQGAFHTYDVLLRGGVTREQARGVLPQCVYTRFYVTANLRSWLHFLTARDHPGAQHEMILYARAVRQIMEPLYPVTFREWRALHV